VAAIRNLIQPPVLSNPPEIAVVVASRGRPERLRATLACLAGCRDQTRDDGVVFEVVLVDDNDPGATPAASDLAPDGLLTRVVSGPCTGRASARNVGADATAADWVVFLDADTLVGPEFVREHAAAAVNGVFVHGRMRELPAAEHFLTQWADASDDEIRRARAGIVDPDAPRDPRCRLVANALERTVEELDAGQHAGIAPWLGCVGANVGVARADWERVGGFDEDFGRTWGCEDLEFGYRLAKAGLCRRLSPGALGLHLSHARPDRWEQHAANLDRFLELHPGPEVEALAQLLGPRGTPAGYAEAVLGSSPGQPASGRTPVPSGGGQR